MPLLYRIAGTLFGITAGIIGLDSLLVATNAPKEMIDTFHTYTNTYAYTDRSPLRSTNYLLEKAIPPIRTTLNSIASTAQEKGFIGNTGLDLSKAAIIDGKTVLAAGIAAWFFKQANSYQETINRLQTELQALPH